MPASHSTAAPEGATRTAKGVDAADIIARAYNLNELIFEASENLSDPNVRTAFQTGISIVGDHLKEALNILVPAMGEKV